MKKKYVPQRHPHNTTIGFSCTKKLKAQISAAAKADRRNLSNWIVCQLEEAVRRQEAQDLAADESTDVYPIPTKRPKKAAEKPEPKDAYPGRKKKGAS